MSLKWEIIGCTNKNNCSANGGEASPIGFPGKWKLQHVLLRALTSHFLIQKKTWKWLLPHCVEKKPLWCPNALCGYPLVKMELDIQTRFLPRLPFSCNSIISDKIWRKMSLSLSIFFSFASNFPCKILWDNKNIDANILIFSNSIFTMKGVRSKKVILRFFSKHKKI